MNKWCTSQYRRMIHILFNSSESGKGQKFFFLNWEKSWLLGVLQISRAECERHLAKIKKTDFLVKPYPQILRHEKKIEINFVVYGHCCDFSGILSWLVRFIGWYGNIKTESMKSTDRVSSAPAVILQQPGEYNGHCKSRHFKNLTRYKRWLVVCIRRISCHTPRNRGDCSYCTH